MTKILLVEDDKSLREIYGVRLLAEGYDIVSAGDGEEALAMAIKERPALIVSDVMMPKISGFDMLDILRSTTETRDVKVIMMTALSSEDQRQRGEALGADRYLVKSQVGIEDVVRTVHEVLGDAPEPTPAPEPAAEPVAAAGAPTTQQDAPAVTLPSPTEIAAADAQARQFLDEISAVPAEQRTVLESDKFAGPIATQVVTPAPTAPMAPLTQDGSATTPTQANPDNSTPPATDPAPFVLPSAAPTPAAPSASTEQTAEPATTEPVTPTDPAPTPAPEVEQPPVSGPAPTTPADALPEPTAPVSSPSPQPTSHGGERVIQPLSQEPQPDMSKMMEQELSDQLESIQASPQPTPDSDDFTLPTSDAMAGPHGDLTLDALEPLPTPADDQPLDAGTAINAELANAASSQPQDDDTPFVLPTPAPMPTDPTSTPTPEPEQTSTPKGEPSPATEPAQPTAPQPPTNAFPPQPPVAS
ncbi:response regulator [Candidatus Saccharibacteria bacterium oral taxon 488]|nr:response regulator [Candidatus Saccharibacteria bacterium oral taxon 488]